MINKEPWSLRVTPNLSVIFILLFEYTETLIVSADDGAGWGRAGRSGEVKWHS